MGTTMWIWVREDGADACVLQVGTPPRGPGRVYEVFGARSRVEAAGWVSRASRPEPDLREDAVGWARWRQAKDATREVQKEEWGG